MSTVIIKNGDLVLKDPADIKIYHMDWGTLNLPAGVTLNTSIWTIKAISPSTTDVALTKDQETILADGTTSRLRLTGGTVGQTYDITNRIVSSESPSQTKERSFRVLIEDL